MENLKDKHIKRSTKASNIRLKDLNKDTLFRKIREVEEFDKIQYRKTCIFHPKFKKKLHVYDEDESDGESSSEESVEYYNCEPYQPGTLGLISFKETKQKSRKMITARKLRPKETEFDLISAIILSEVGLLNKFMKKDKYYVKVEPKIREKRKFYDEPVHLT